MNLTPLKHLLFLENMTTVFKNYSCLKRRNRILVVCWVFLEIWNVTLSVIANITCEKEFRVKAQQIYFVSSTGFSIYIMISALYYSKRFYNLLFNFDTFFKIFNDVLYNHRLMKAQKVFTMIAVPFCVIKIFAYAYVRLYNDDFGLGIITTTISQYCISMSDFRYIFQYFILHSIFFVVAEQLKAITRSVDSELLAIRKHGGKEEYTENLHSIPVKYEKLNKWVKAYDSVKDSSDLCNSMFSIQLSMMLLIVTAYYIILLYNIAITTVKGGTSLTGLLLNLFSMVVFLMALLVISRAGQKIQNNSIQLQQKLCELCVHTLGNEEYYKLVKDLLRCVRTRPVRIHVLGSLDVNQSMLPSIVAVFTSYTVIALQFNNVL